MSKHEFNFWGGVAHDLITTIRLFESDRTRLVKAERRAAILKALRLALAEVRLAEEAAT